MLASEFFSDFKTPFNTYPFSKISESDYLPFLKEAIEISTAKRDEIINNSEEPTFENLVEAIEFHDATIEKIASVFFNLLHAERTENLQNIANEFNPLITSYYNDLKLNEKLFEKVEIVYNKRKETIFDREQRVVVEKLYKDFLRNGAKLSEKQKNEIRDIDEKLSKLGLQFSDNILKEKNSFELIIDDKSELEGLEEDFIGTLAQKAKDKGQEGKYCVTLDAPTYIPFMKGAKNRGLRQKLYMGNSTVAFADNEFNNSENIKEITRLRYRRANILGYQNHAKYVLEERMAEEPRKVRDFLTNLLIKAKPYAEREVEELRVFADEIEGVDELYPWDFSYYSEKLKKKKFDLDDEILKPYFEIQACLKGAFTVANKLYNLTFSENDNIEKYNEEVKVFEVKEKEHFVGLLYVDLHPREGKLPGAWATSFKGQCWHDGVEQRPHGSIVCNFSRPTADKPSLLTFGELTTLFHEFGHALHGLLSECHYPSVSGTSVFWDFVELPSQVMENWCFEKECLDIFAKHYQTGEELPFELVQKIKESSNFQDGYATMRQLSFAFLDLAWHSMDTTSVDDIEEFEKIAMEQTSLLPRIPNTSMSTSFGHIFSGGYSAGYYSYKWAEVLDAEAFERFKESGIFNKEIAQKFRKEVLSKGGSDHPMNLFKKFNGKEPSVDALLKRSGLV